MKRPERPSAVLVVAILELSFGGLALVAGLCGILGLLIGRLITGLPGAQARPNVEAIMRAKVPYYDAIQCVDVTLTLLTGIVLITSGIGLLRLRPWVRWLTIGYACWYIVSSILRFLFALTVIQPIMHEVIAEMRADPKMPPQAGHFLDMSESIGTSAAYVPLIFLAVPIAILIIMFLPHVKAAFRPIPPQLSEEEEFEDDDRSEEEVPPSEAPVAPREEHVQPGDNKGAETGG
jgi:hypothetical protein